MLSLLLILLLLLLLLLLLSSPLCGVFTIAIGLIIPEIYHVYTMEYYSNIIAIMWLQYIYIYIYMLYVNVTRIP
jgi:hypothetical protein